MIKHMERRLAVRAASHIVLAEIYEVEKADPVCSLGIGQMGRSVILLICGPAVENVEAALPAV